MHKNIRKIFVIIINFIFILGLIKGFSKQQSFFSLYLFTRQTILLINIYFIFFYRSKMKKYLSFISAINCLFLLFYNFKIENKQLYTQRTLFDIIVANLEHIFLPIFFLYYYFFLNKTTLKLHQFYIGLIYPFIYLISCFMIQQSPYKFLIIPTHFVELLYYIILLFVLSFISLLFIFIKNKIITTPTTKTI